MASTPLLPPLADLHLHLDGSLSPSLVRTLAKKDGSPELARLSELSCAELTELLSVPEDCESLNDYLKCFDLPLSVLQREEQISLAVEDLLGRLRHQGISYAEIRFAPQLHTNKGLTQEDVVLAALEGLKKGTREPLSGDPPIRASLILCCMRGKENESANLETIRLAAGYLGRGVCAADLAGTEALYPNELFEPVFSKARELAVPFTIHAGEAAGPESIRSALKMGAMRIGHGIRAIEDPGLIEELRDRQIPLEVCPTSNVQTRAARSYAEHPILQLLRMGLLVTVNTDNLTVSRITLPREYEKLRTILGMTDDEMLLLRKNSFKWLFSPEEYS
ncbi:MAG: adenosine deaminase [Lachnospiraceae bacterium]|nr:adenosine deaminase [Lachnospiraceae bacterium]